MTTTADLFINQGETFTVAFPVIDATGAAVWVQGWTARMQVRTRPDSPNVLHQWSTEDNTLTCTDTAVTVTVPAALSSSWSFRSAHYDLELGNPAGAVARIAAGLFYLVPEITR